MDNLQNFLARRSSGELTLIAFLGMVMLFACGIWIGEAIGSL